MAPRVVQFAYFTGLDYPIFRAAQLSGGWDANGRRSDTWTTVPMEQFTAEDGCPAFRAAAVVDDDQDGQLQWGVIVDGPAGANVWGLPTGVADRNSTERYRSFDPRTAGEEQRYHLTDCRRLGANRVMRNGAPDAVEFAVWAPNARSVEVLLGQPASGYI